MNQLITFEEFLAKGIVTKRTPEKSRAVFLIKEAERKYKSYLNVIEKIGITELNSHEIIEYCYDILIYLLRAKLCQDGFGGSGEGSHEAEVSYMRKIGFNENEVNFMNQLRYFRNGIKYYGKSLDKEYAEKVNNFQNKIYPRLLKIVNF